MTFRSPRTAAATPRAGGKVLADLVPNTPAGLEAQTLGTAWTRKIAGFAAEPTSRFTEPTSRFPERYVVAGMVNVFVAV